jgi:hypothetical protein
MTILSCFLNCEGQYLIYIYICIDVVDLIIYQDRRVWITVTGLSSLCVYIYMCIDVVDLIIYQDRRVWITVTGLSSQHLCVCLQPESGFPKPYFVAPSFVYLGACWVC